MTPPAPRPLPPLLERGDNIERPLSIGEVVSQRIDGEAAHQPITGMVVGRWVSDDDEPGVILVSLWRKEARLHRLLVADCVTGGDAVRPANSVASHTKARGIMAVLGTGSSCLSDRERALLWYCVDLTNADRPGAA